MRRRRFVHAVGIGLAVLALVTAGCGSKTPTADDAKQQCFANQRQIKQAMDLVYADSNIYAPISDVVGKLHVTCPSGGTYTCPDGTDQISCTVHGPAPAP